MFAKRSAGSLCAAVAVSFLLSYGTATVLSSAHSGAARSPFPVAGGWVIDHGPEVGSPRDGIPDDVEEEPVGNPIILTSLAETQVVLEFDLQSVDSSNVKMAFLKLVVIGLSFFPGTSSIPVEVYGFAGDGSIQLDDFNAGTLIAVFDVPTDSNDSKPIFVDVADFVRSQQPGFVGFNFRTTLEGVQVNLSSSNTQPPPLLVIGGPRH